MRLDSSHLTDSNHHFPIRGSREREGNGECLPGGTLREFKIKAITHWSRMNIDLYGPISILCKRCFG